MFYGGLILGLLSLVTVSSNNQLVSTTFTSSYDEPNDVYFVRCPNLVEQTNYILRYNNTDLISFVPKFTSENVFECTLLVKQSFNFSVYSKLYDINSALFDTVSFCPLTASETGYEDMTWTLSVDFTNSTYHPYDALFYLTFSIRLLDENVYNSFLNGIGGYTQGYENGYANGKAEGFETGRDNGYSIGSIEGYEHGYDDGYGQGYLDGGNDYASTHDFSFHNLLWSIGDTPILMLRRLFGFELFGMQVMSIFMSLFTFIIVIHIIKKVF